MKENQAPTTSDGCDEERPHEGFVASVRTGRQDESAEEEPNVIATADGQESKLEHCESLGAPVGDDVGGNVVGDDVGIMLAVPSGVNAKVKQSGRWQCW